MSMNRQERRARMKESKNGAIPKRILEVNSNLLDELAMKIVSSSENPFILDEYNIDIIPFAIWSIAEVSDAYILRNVKGMFYKYVNVFELASCDDDTEIQEHESYIAHNSKRRELYLTLLKMSKLSKKMCMQIMITSSLEMVYTILDRAKESIKEKSVLEVKNNSEVSNVYKQVDSKYNFDILASMLVIYWAIKSGLVQKKAVEMSYGVQYDASLIDFISKSVPNSSNYIKWIKGNKQFGDAMVESGDVECNPVNFCIINTAFRYMRSKIIEEFVSASDVPKVVDERDNARNEVAKCKEKMKEVKKQKSEALKEIKDKDKIIDELQVDGKTKDTRIKQLEELVDNQVKSIENLNADLINIKNNSKELDELISLRGKVKAYENDIASYKNKIKELKTCSTNTEEIQQELSSTREELDSAKKTIEILTIKLNIAISKK